MTRLATRDGPLPGVIDARVLAAEMAIDVFDGRYLAGVSIVSFGAVGDGSTVDTSAILTAIDTVGEGGVLWVPEGIFMLDDGILLPTGMWFGGPGTLKFVAGVDASTKMIRNDDNAGGNQDITLWGLTLDGNRAANSAILGLTAVAFSNVQDTTVWALKIKGFTQHGVDFTGTNTTSAGAGVNTGCVVAFCRIKDYGTDHVGFGIDFVGGGIGNQIVANQIQSTNPNVGIGIDDQSGPQESDPCFDILVAHNTVDGGEDCVLIESSHRVSVVHNNFKNAERAGVNFAEGAETISPEDCDVAHNHITDCVRGVQLLGNGNKANHNTIRGGTIGIDVADVSLALVPSRHLSASHNDIAGCSSHGIQAQGRGVRVNDNDIDDVGGKGIHVFSAERLTQQISVKINRISNTGEESIHVEQDTNGLAYITVHGNDCVNPSLDDTTAAIVITGTADTVDIANNTIHEDGSFNITAGIDIDAAATLVTRSNNRLFRTTAPLEAGTDANPEIVALSVDATLNFGSINNQGMLELTTTVTGAAVGDSVIVTPSAAVMASAGEVAYTGYVSAADTVKVRAVNVSGGTRDPDSGTFRITVLRY